MIGDARRILAFECVRKSDRFTNTRHSRESGNPLRRFRKKNRSGIVDGRLRIPAFAGMTSICNAVRFLYTLPRGNDEVLSQGFRLSLRRLSICPAAIVRADGFLHTLFRENDGGCAGFRNAITHCHAPMAGSGTSQKTQKRDPAVCGTGYAEVSYRSFRRIDLRSVRPAATVVLKSPADSR